MDGRTIHDYLKKLEEIDGAKSALNNSAAEIRNKLYKEVEAVLPQIIAGTAWGITWSEDFSMVTIEMFTLGLGKHWKNAFYDLLVFYAFKCKVVLYSDFVRVTGKPEDIAVFARECHIFLATKDIDKVVDEHLKDVQALKEMKIVLNGGKVDEANS